MGKVQNELHRKSYTDDLVVIGKPSPYSCYYLLQRTPGILIFFISRDLRSSSSENKKIWWMILLFFSFFFFLIKIPEHIGFCCNGRVSILRAEQTSPLTSMKGQQPSGYSQGTMIPQRGPAPSLDKTLCLPTHKMHILTLFFLKKQNCEMVRKSLLNVNRSLKYLDVNCCCYSFWQGTSKRPGASESWWSLRPHWVWLDCIWGL